MNDAYTFYGHKIQLTKEMDEMFYNVISPFYNITFNYPKDFRVESEPSQYHLCLYETGAIASPFPDKVLLDHWRQYKHIVLTMDKNYYLTHEDYDFSISINDVYNEFKEKCRQNIISDAIMADHHTYNEAIISIIEELFERTEDVLEIDEE